MMPQAAFTAEQLELVHRLIEKGRNVKTSHVVETMFAGITEVTNWVICFQPPLESDPVSRLSFAHQEAPLGIFGRRPLHTLESLATYLNFLHREMEDSVNTQPVKAMKRAIPWIRLFQHDDLRRELTALARRHQAPQCARQLSGLKLLETYSGRRDLKPGLQELLASLRTQLTDAARDLLIKMEDFENLLTARVHQFGQALTTTASSSTDQPSLLRRILSLAEAEGDY